MFFYVFLKVQDTLIVLDWIDSVNVKKKGGGGRTDERKQNVLTIC